MTKQLLKPFLMRFLVLSISSLMVLPLAYGQHKGINFQAVIKKPDGSYPTVSGISITAQILDPINNCVLREELHTGKNISNGYLNLVLGDSGASTPSARNPSPVLSISESLNNALTRRGLNAWMTRTIS